MNPLIFSIPNVCHCEKVHKSHPPSSQGPWDSWALNHGRSKALTSCAKVKLGQEFAGLNFLNRGTPISEWEWWPNNYGNKKGVETNFWKGTDGVFWTIFFCLILTVNFPMLEKTVHAPRSFTICFALPGSSYRHTTRPAVQIQWPFQHFRGGIWHEIASAKRWKMRKWSSRSQWTPYLVTLQHFDEPKTKMFVNLQQPLWYLFGGCLCYYKSLRQTTVVDVLRCN